MPKKYLKIFTVMNVHNSQRPSLNGSEQETDPGYLIVPTITQNLSNLKTFQIEIQFNPDFEFCGSSFIFNVATAKLNV